MYKPNGEEPMTKQEEARRRAAIAEKTRRQLKPEGIRTAFYEALFGAAHQTDERVGVSISQAQ